MSDTQKRVEVSSNDLQSTNSSVRREQPAYQLAHKPDGTSWTTRENLADIFERELLGPANGAEEVLEGSPDAAYLLGRIAPVRLTSGDSEPATTDDSATDVGDDVDARESRGVPVTAVDESSAESDEDNAEDQPQRRGLMIPASMGLRFQIRDDLPSFTVTASWGTYHAVRSESDESSYPRYQRTPVDIKKRIDVSSLSAGQTTTIPLQADISLRIDTYADTTLERLLVDIALCNDRETPPKIPVDAWLYQTKLYVESDDSPAAFLPVQDVLEDPRRERNDELRRLNLQYRDRLEFAIGRTCSVDWHVDEGERCASKVWTTWLPTTETPQTTAREIESALLDMEALAVAEIQELDSGLRPIVDGYATWLTGEQARAEKFPDHLREDALELVAEARQVHAQLSAGLEHLLSDPHALKCFQFMNRVMADQRIQTQVGELRTTAPKLSIKEAREQVLADKGALAHSWRTFQLAFILMQLPALTDPTAEVRSGELTKAQLLFFPTGGGKTEAYLGLAAFTFAIRRLQGQVATSDGQLNGLSGVAVLMRYTLRLLTAQQFQRATALVCAAEVARRADLETWGAEPFRIGLWVGTDVSPKRFEQAEDQLKKANQGYGHRLTVLQVQRCPWCGSKIDSRQVEAKKSERRVYVYCSDWKSDGCPFNKAGDGLPILTVDEEIYRLAPAFVIATVDKFARLAREGEAASLFGYVSKQCDRHGYVHPDYSECTVKDKHPANNGLPPAAVRPAGRLRPPDLIIQDELHLISGSLGTTVGLFEVAVDTMCSWTDATGKPVRPLLVASTATVRNAPEHVRALYGRGVTVFPPQVLDVGNTFFSQEEPVSEKFPGRRYVGVSTTGVRLTTAEIRISEILLAAGQLLLDTSGETADPYMTLVGYFNATRELAGMARYMTDDIQTALTKRRPWSLLPRRTGTDFGRLNIAELTSRVASAEITQTLDEMAVTFDPAFDSADAKRAAVAASKAAKAAGESSPNLPTRDVNPFDVILATSMLQVGVDVTRLGLMLLVGQPKNTAEYIQASSRVGRDPKRPGLVVTLGNWARPRDLAHFEQFKHYHETFYKQVEALSVTPFSTTSLERGLDGVLVSASRVLQAGTATGLSPENNAGRVIDEHAAVETLIALLVERIKRASDEDSAKLAAQRLANRLDQWEKRKSYLGKQNLGLVYERVKDEAHFGPLIISAENHRAQNDSADTPPFVVANSMREVQPEINLLVSPLKERLFVIDPDGAPTWTMPANKEPDA